MMKVQTKKNMRKYDLQVTGRVCALGIETKYLCIEDLQLEGGMTNRNV